MSRFAEFDKQLSTAAIRCKMCAIIAELPPEDAEYIRWMMAQPMKDKGHKHIASVLGRAQIEISESTVGSCRAAKHQADAA